MVKEKSFYVTLLSIALPVAFQNLIGFGVNMLDTVMVGSLGEVQLSSVALANQISILMMMFIRGMSGGSSVLLSQYWGRRDMTRIKTVMGIGMKICVLVSAIATTVVALFPQGVMHLLTNDPQLIVEGARYLAVVCFSYLLMSVSDTLIAMLRCVEVVNVSLFVSIVSFFVNVGGNYVLIFGKLGFPAMGVFGAGLATVIARGVELCLVLSYVIFVDKRMKLTLPALWKNDRLLWLDFLRYGGPIVLGDVLWGLVGTTKAAIIGRLGAEAVAANSMAEVVLQLSTVFIFGLSSASCVMIGKTVGAKDYARTREYSKTLQIMYACFGVVAGLFTYFIRNLAVSFYNVPDATRLLGSQFLIAGAITIAGTSYAAACFLGINRGAGDSKFVVKTDMICGWLIVIPMTYLTGIILGAPLPLVYFASRCDQLVKVVIAFVRLRGNRWIRNVTREEAS